MCASPNPVDLPTSQYIPIDQIPDGAVIKIGSQRVGAVFLANRHQSAQPGDAELKIERLTYDDVTTFCEQVPFSSCITPPEFTEVLQSLESGTMRIDSNLEQSAEFQREYSSLVEGLISAESLDPTSQGLFNNILGSFYAKDCVVWSYKIGTSQWGCDLSDLSPHAKVLKRIQLEVDNISSDVKEALRDMLIEHINKFKEQTPVSGMTPSQIYNLTLFVETAMALGASFTEVGEPYDTIECRMRPYLVSKCPGYENIDEMYLSENGFLGPEDRLEPTIEQDRQWLAERGFTAQDVGKPLEFIREEMFKSEGDSIKVRINGRVFVIKKTAGFSLTEVPYAWMQSCPFLDSTDNYQMDVLVRDRKTRKTFFFPTLLPHLISAHVFFEGEHAGHYGGPEAYSFRVEPKTIIDFFHLKPGEFSAEVL